MSIRASVAIKAAVELGGDINTVFENADAINAWLIEKSSEPASSAYPQVEDDSPRTPMQPAGAGSEDRGVGVGEATDVAESLGEGTPASTPPVAHDVQHTHDWQLRQGVRGFLVCDCGATRKKETVP